MQDPPNQLATYIILENRRCRFIHPMWMICEVQQQIKLFSCE